MDAKDYDRAPGTKAGQGRRVDYPVFNLNQLLSSLVQISEQKTVASQADWRCFRRRVRFAGFYWLGVAPVAESLQGSQSHYSIAAATALCSSFHELSAQASCH